VPGWAGFYAGVNLGGAQTREQYDTTAFAGGVFINPVNLRAFDAAGTGDARHSSVIGGVQAGYNWQFGTFFTGVEADISGFAGNTELTRTAPVPLGAFAGTPFTVSTATHADWLVTVRQRAGLALDSALIYVTGGVALTQIRHSASFVDQTAIPDIGSGQESRLVPGWVAGGGVEWALGPRWSAKAEYLYAQFADSTLGYSFDFTGNSAPNPMAVRERLSLQIARVGLNYRFGATAAAGPAITTTALYTKANVMKAHVMKAPARAAGFDWSGVYAGVNLGFARTQSDFATTVFPGIFASPLNLAAFGAGGTGSAQHDGFTGGGQIGANGQFGALVVGLEADLSGFDGSATLNGGTAIPTIPGSSFAVTSTAKVDWLLTVRPRVGVAFDRALIYGTGGIAVARLRTAGTFADNTPPPADSGAGERRNTVGGWTAGGGVEFAVLPDWSVKAEYLYTKLAGGTLDYAIDFPGNIGTTNHVQVTDSVTLQTVKVGVNYRFGGP
jgi:outer membrane immunogenic protein